MDIFNQQKRSEIMSRVRGKDTKPELQVRSFLHATGLRYILHNKKLPGKPDLSFPSRKLALFVHGCFWHGHAGCKRANMPATRPDFWRKKIESNIARDRQNQEALSALGWEVRILWQCAINDAALSNLACEITCIPLRNKSSIYHGCTLNAGAKASPPKPSLRCT